jgi:hypothetical protein
MTILAKIGPIKSMFGRPKGADIIEAYRFTKDYAVQTAVRARNSPGASGSGSTPRTN